MTGRFVVGLEQSFLCETGYTSDWYLTWRPYQGDENQKKKGWSLVNCKDICHSCMKMSRGEDTVKWTWYGEIRKAEVKATGGACETGVLFTFLKRIPVNLDMRAKAVQCMQSKWDGCLIYIFKAQSSEFSHASQSS